MNPVDKAVQVKRLIADPTFVEIMQEVRDRQHKVFDDSSSSPDAILEAHSILRALSKIDGVVQGILNNAAVETRKENQHRGSHD
jgi:hypothetical protein